MPKSLEELLEPVLIKYNSAKMGISSTGDLVVSINPDQLYDFMQKLQKDRSLQFDHVSLVTAVDWLDKFEVIYKIYSYSKKFGLEVKTSVSRETPIVSSITSIWGGANWQEREVYDFYGVIFEGHPNLTRLFVSDDFPGYPFRKDWPLENNEEYILRERN